MSKKQRKLSFLVNLLYVLDLSINLHVLILGLRCPKQHVGQLPLVMAGLHGCSETITALVEAGAEIHRQDDNGHNILHAIVCFSQRDQEKGCQLLQLVIDFVPTWIQLSKDAPHFRNMESEKYGSNCAIYQLFKTETLCGLTPLKLAVKFSLTKVVKFILNLDQVYRWPYVALSRDREMSYDVTEIEPLLNQDSRARSVLELNTRNTVPERSLGIQSGLSVSSRNPRF